MVIAVDIDGTLTVETSGWGEAYRNRTPKKENINFINELSKSNTIVLYTARYPEDEEVTRHWLKNNNVIFHRLIMGKFNYDVLLDDKALTLEDFRGDKINE